MKTVGVQINLVVSEGLFGLLDQVAGDNFKSNDVQGELAQLFLRCLELYCSECCYDPEYIIKCFQPENLSIHDIKVI